MGEFGLLLIMSFEHLCHDMFKGGIRKAIILIE